MHALEQVALYSPKRAQLAACTLDMQVSVVAVEGPMKAPLPQPDLVVGWASRVGEVVSG